MISLLAVASQHHCKHRSLWWVGITASFPAGCQQQIWSSHFTYVTSLSRACTRDVRGYLCHIVSYHLQSCDNKHSTYFSNSISCYWHIYRLNWLNQPKRRSMNNHLSIFCVTHVDITMMLALLPAPWHHWSVTSARIRIMVSLLPSADTEPTLECYCWHWLKQNRLSINNC